MIQSKHYKLIVLLLGCTLSLAGFFLPIQKICDLEESDGTMRYLYISGKNSLDFYAGFFFSLVALVISATGTGRAALHGILINCAIGVLFLIVNTSLGTAGWGRPCGTSPTPYFFLMFSGHLSLIAYSFWHLSERNQKITDKYSDF